MYLPEVRVCGYLGARGTLGRSLEAVDAWEMKTRKEVVARRAATTSGLQPGTSPGVSLSLLRTETRQPIERKSSTRAAAATNPKRTQVNDSKMTHRLLRWESSVRAAVRVPSRELNRAAFWQDSELAIAPQTCRHQAAAAAATAFATKWSHGLESLVLPSSAARPRRSARGRRSPATRRPRTSGRTR